MARYRSEVAAGVIVPDPAQERAISALERIHGALADRRRQREQTTSGGTGWFGLRFREWRRRPRPAPIAVVRGAYLWGPVGRGKTHLMNVFFDAVQGPKLRLHFHHFMRRIHDELATLTDQQSPLATLAGRLAAETDVVCLDEFHVSDIADAMLLSGLLEALFRRGVTLVTTSNVAPERLYRDGLQRARFLPAITLLERHTQVVRVDGQGDYRLRALERAEIYHVSEEGAAVRERLGESFRAIAGEEGEEGGTIEILGRMVPVERRADGVVWFRFSSLCDGPRSASDYIELARLFHTVILSGVPRFGIYDDDRARRFIALVDEFYDRNVNLVVSAAASPGELYEGRRKAFEFKRVVSRLVEMQSRQYLARPHLP